MEEINIFLNDKLNIYYLSLFDNIIKDENYFRIGNYKLDDYILDINYDNGLIEKFNYKKSNDNIKIYEFLSSHNIELDKSLIELDNVPIKQDNLLENQNELNIKDNNFIYIVHNNWEDKLILRNDKCNRLSNNDNGKFEIYDNTLFIKWNDYDEEVFLLDEVENKYYLQEKKIDEIDEIDEIKLENKIIENKIYIKNYSWEDEVILDYKNNKCIRLNINKDEGTFKIDNNHLTIKWKDWEEEVFYKKNNHYVNNKNFIKKFKFLLENYQKDYEMDLEYIYISDKKYKYKLENKKLTIDDYEFNEFVFLDNEFYNMYYFDLYLIEDNVYYIFKNENIILNTNFIILGKFTKKNQEILNIKWFNDDNYYYKIDKSDIKCRLLKCESIKLQNDNISKYYQCINLLYDENFDKFIKFKIMNDKQLILDNNLTYTLIDEIYVLDKNNIQRELILYENDFIHYYYLDNYIFNTDCKYLTLIDDNFENIYIKKNGLVYIYTRLYDNVYIIDNLYKTIRKNNFNELIFKYFDNHLERNNQINNIIDNNIIYNQDTFHNNFIFLENIDFKNYNTNIFESYGYLIIQDKNIKVDNINILNIINFSDNKNFMYEQDLWIDYLKTNNKDTIYIFDDYSNYDFMNNIFEFDKNFKNYIILINYTKCKDLLSFYINKILDHIDKEKKIKKINYIKNINIEKKNILKINDIIIDQNFYNLIFNIYDFIIFVIYFYIKNKNNIQLSDNYEINIDLFKKFKF